MELLSNGIGKAISWTLIHSLWLGLILAIIAGITILLTKKSTSALRYNLLAFQCVLFLIAMIFTFNYENHAHQSEVQMISKSAYLHQNISAISSHDNNTSLDVSNQSFSENLNNFINNYSTWIVCFWFLFFIFKLLKMGNELRSIYRIRNYQIIEPSEIWTAKLENLKNALQINRNIKLLESKLVTVPSVTGFLKPIILIPLGLMNNLPQDQVEAILLHELAHVKRSDYFINLIQNLMEIIFFFNPGVLWISSLLKEERENCCDDLAIGVTNDKKVFVNALISFQQYNLSNQHLAMEFGNRKLELKDRAKRILFNDNKVLNNLEKSFLSICIVVGTALCFAFASYDSNPLNENPQKNKTTTNSISSSETTTISDSLYINRKYYPDSIPEGTVIYFTDEIDHKKYFSYLFKHEGILYQMSQDLKTISVNGKAVHGKEKNKYAEILKPFVTDFENNFTNKQNEQISNSSEQISNASDKINVLAASLHANPTELAAIETNIEKEHRKIEAESKKIEAQAKIIEMKVQRMEKKSFDPQEIEAQSKRIEAESRRIEAQSKEIEVRSRMIEEKSKKIEIESKRIEVESKRIEAESHRIEKESKRIEAESKKINHSANSISQFPAPPTQTCSPK